MKTGAFTTKEWIIKLTTTDQFSIQEADSQAQSGLWLIKADLASFPLAILISRSDWKKSLRINLFYPYKKIPIFIKEIENKLTISIGT